MRYLFRKTLRDILKAKGQFIAISLVIAVGVSMFISLITLDKSLNSAVNGFYKEQNLSDFIINFSSVDDSGIASINSIDEIEHAEGRIFLNGSLLNGESQYFVHSVSSTSKISLPKIIEGRLPSSGEIIVDSAHFQAANLSLNQKLRMSIDGKEYEFTISGIFISPEYIYLTDSIQNFMPNHKKFGAIFVHESFISEHFGQLMFNQVLVTTKLPIAAIELEQKLLAIPALNGYGFLTARQEILSVTILHADIAQLGNMGLWFAILFFVVAAAIILISMSRCITLERNQIGIMKAIGQKNSNILLHYLSKSAITVLFGSMIGTLLGVFLLPKVFLSAYASIYTLPPVSTSGFAWSIFMSTLLALAFGIVATLISCAKVLRERPSDAMRPLPPKKIKPILLEKNEKLWGKISHSNKLILRNIFANKTRAALSSIGIIASVGLIIASFSLLNMFTNIIDTKFIETNVHDIVVQLAVPLPSNTDLYSDIEGISDITKQSSISASFSSQERTTTTTLVALNKDGKGINLFAPNGKRISLTEDGVLLPKLFSDNLGLNIGDKLLLRLMLPLGESREVEVRVSGLYMAYLEQNIYASLEYMESLYVELDLTTLLISFNSEADKSAITEEISSSSFVHSVIRIEELIKATRDSMSIVNSFMAFIIAMAAILALTVIYNITAINISERRRDIATLKVLGYRAKEVNRLIFIENILITAFGALIGIFTGAAMLYGLMQVTMPENMMIPYSLSVSSVLIGVALGFVFTTLANFLLRRNTKKIDMVESLKSVE